MESSRKGSHSRLQLQPQTTAAWNACGAVKSARVWSLGGVGVTGFDRSREPTTARGCFSPSSGSFVSFYCFFFIFFFSLLFVLLFPSFPGLQRDREMRAAAGIF